MAADKVAVNGDGAKDKSKDRSTEDSSAAKKDDATAKTDDDDNDTADMPTGSKPELKIWQQRYKRDGSQETVSTTTLARDQVFDSGYALVAQQVFTERNRLELTRLRVNSSYLLRALKEVVGSYPTVPSDFEQPLEMESPFRMLYHYWDDLERYRDGLAADEEGDAARVHLGLLLDFMQQDMGPERARVEGMRRKAQIDFPRLWTIFRPGAVAISYEKTHAWLLRVAKTAYEESTKMGKWMEVHCTYTDYDGAHVGLARKVFKIYQKESFASENPANIRDLGVYPRVFCKEGPELEARLKKRGERYLTFTGVQTKAYDGLADYIKEPPFDYWNPDMADFDPVWWPYAETGRVVLDRNTFQEDNYLATVAIMSDDEEREAMLCQPYFYGYSLARKEWCRFYVDTIRDIDFNRNAMDDLIMKESQKTLLKALVSSHSFPDNARDQVQQKGKGLVCLLHGTPGSGKTLTAECVAEMCSRPLISTSMAELNKHNNAWYFEYRLKQVLQYATIWKAVVLLDEADVFLEARKDEATSDAGERNALVAVFLRHLEYFSGIVFLTTNRVQVFDAAMKSRTHLALGYDPPELEMRRQIWDHALRKVPAEEREVEVEDAIDALIDEKLNGREIANAITTARTLARFDKVPLQLKHLETVLGVRKEFEISLQRMGARAMSKDPSKVGPAMGPPVRQGSVLGEAIEES